MYCDNCGYEITGDFAFCPMCGKKIEETGKLGKAEAMEKMGIIYDNDEIVEQGGNNPEQHEKAESGPAAEMNHLGDAYRSGDGVQQDYQKAFDCFEEAANLGNAEAMEKMGLMYDNGEGVEQDRTIALGYYKLAAEKRNSNAIYRIGEIYRKGEGVEQDYQKAFDCFEEAANLGNAEAMEKMGFMYDNGEGVEQDRTIALGYYKLAAEKRNSNAINGTEEKQEASKPSKMDPQKTLQPYNSAALQENDNTKKTEELLSQSSSIANELEYIDCANNQYDSSQFEKDNADAIEQYNKAKQMLINKEPEFAMLSIRKCLEILVERLCAKCGIDTTAMDSTLERRINALNDRNVLSAYDTSLFHRIRINSNKGVHDTTDLQTANHIFDDLTQALDVIRKVSGDTDYGKVIADNNKPMENPDYYDSKRRYYGLWEKCYIRQELMSNPDYVELSSKADAGDIDAMLDIATGFLPRRDGINWQQDLDLINYPIFRSKGTEYNKSYCYDVRFYHWVTRAAEFATRAFMNNPNYKKEVSLKYIATALLEAKKFNYFSTYQKLNYFFSPTDLRYMSQEEVELDAFGCISELDLQLEFNYSKFLRKLLEENPGKQIISPAHLENSMKHILFIDYCHMYIVNDILDGIYQYSITSENAITSDDIGKPITKELLTKYCDDPICEPYADIALNYKGMEEFYAPPSLSEEDVSKIFGSFDEFLGMEAPSLSEEDANEIFGTVLGTVDEYFAKARGYYEKAAEHGSERAMLCLGNAYEYGKGVEADYKKALEYYEKAANLGNAQAMKKMGDMFCDDKGVEADYKKALEYYEKAANLGNAQAMKKMGDMFCDGKGVEADYKKALEYYEAAENLGCGCEFSIDQAKDALKIQSEREAMENGKSKKGFFSFLS